MFVGLFLIFPAALAGTCTYTEWGNGFIDTSCATTDPAYNAPCATAGSTGYCHGLQLDPCASYEPNGYDINAGNEPDGVTRTCEQFETGRSHVVCCRPAPSCDDESVQCTALKDPDGPQHIDNCITPGPNKEKNPDGTDKLDDPETNRDQREFHQYHTPVNGEWRDKPQNDTVASWSYAYETCSNLDGGDKGWRLCQQNEILSGACCKEASGVNMCEFHDADVWLDEYSFCDSVTTCGIVLEWQKVKGPERGQQNVQVFRELFCESTEETYFTSSRGHLCTYYEDTPGGVDHCVPKGGQKLMGDNSGLYGYFVTLFNTSIATFPYPILDRNDLDDGISYILANMTQTEADAYSVCPAGIDLAQCVRENIPFTYDAEMGDWEECESKPGDDAPIILSRRLNAGSRSAIENAASLFSPRTYAYVVDTGVRATHASFGDRVLPGYDVWEGTHNAEGTGDPRSGHGTHVAGTIAGTAYDGVNPTGAAQKTYIVPVQLFDKNGFGDLGAFYRALKWIYTDMLSKPKGRFVINLSLCKPSQDSDNQGKVQRSDVQLMINRIKANRGILVSAACNKGEPVKQNMFGNYPGIVVVGSNPSDPTKLSTFSGWDVNVDVHTKGERIYAASNKNDIDIVKKSGTSMATPYISGVFAKLWEIHPEKSSDELIQYFKDNCVDTNVITSTSRHTWCAKGSGACPVEITPSRVNVELDNCLTGVVVQCPEESTACLADIAEMYGCDEGCEVTLIGDTDSVAGSIGTVDIEPEKYRVSGVGITTAAAPFADIPKIGESTWSPTVEGYTYAPVASTEAPTSEPTEETSDIGPIIGGIVGGIVVLGGLGSLVWTYCLSPEAQGYTKV